jgi:hypothetical protein
MDDVFKHLGYLLGGGCNEGLILYSLGELVNGNINIFKSTWSRLKGRNHIQSPASKKAKMLGWFEGLTLEHESW